VIDNEDDAWLEGLAGRLEPAQIESAFSRQLVFEGAALREFIRRQPPPAAPEIPVSDVARELEVIARARREGLLPLAADRAHARRRLRRVSLAAAAVLILAVGASIWHTSLPPQEVLRGVNGGTVLLEARDPAALRRELTEELHAAGVTVSGYERLGRFGIDADLPRPLPPQIAKILERHHIPAPADGALAIEIEARVPP
jgi:hypothetical protein